ncbi:hypothetical protein MBANPS3_008605 [Mucor bainieri]
MKKPLLHGLKPDYTFDSDACRNLKIDSFLSGLPATDWCDVNRLTSAFTHAHENENLTAAKAFSTICHAFDVISSSRKKYLALNAYVTDVLKYIKSKEMKNKFNGKYETAQIEAKARFEAHNNALRLQIVESKKYAAELDEQIECSSTTDTATDTSSSTRYLNKRERDEFYPADRKGKRRATSVGSAIKLDALNSFESYVQSEKLSSYQKKNMSAGLSSVLDLVDQSDEGQQSLFTKAEWEDMKLQMTQRYGVQYKRRVPDRIATSWDIITGLSQKNQNFDVARVYLARLKVAPNYQDIKKYLVVLEICLNILEHNPKIFEKKHADRLTEYDYLNKVWTPLIDAVFAINGSIIRMKSGESINDISTSNKQEVYHDRSSIAGFKIDMRFLYDTDEHEYDIGAGEATKAYQEAKLVDDLSKLIRESKDVLDGLMNIVLDDHTANKLESWFLQICGLSAEIGSTHLAFDGLYVAVPQGKLRFPSSIATMGSFVDFLDMLLLLTAKLEKCVISITSAVEELENRRNSIGIAFSRNRSLLHGKRRDAWMRPTYYSPPRDVAADAKLPVNLFGLDKDDSDAPSEQDVEDDQVSDASDMNADQFGWVYQNGAWRNVFVKESGVDTHHPDEE